MLSPKTLPSLAGVVVVLLLSFISCISACRIVPKEQVSQAVLYGLATSEAPFEHITFLDGKIFQHADDVAPVSITFYDEYKATKAPGAFLMSDVYEDDLEIWMAINVKDGGDTVYVNTVTERDCDLYDMPLSSAVQNVFSVTSKVKQED
jgi:hypothetical protein